MPLIAGLSAARKSAEAARWQTSIAIRNANAPKNRGQCRLVKPLAVLVTLDDGWFSINIKP
jgi:hypothetical protein